jgi:LacI family transcriptional regulator
VKAKKMVTMTDVARQAGVTAATVSMSLRNQPSIPLATRERIAGIAKALGYRPNPFVSALMRCRRQRKDIVDRPVLALVCALDQPDGWRNALSPTRRLIYQGASERMEQYGYQPQEFWLHRDGMSPERFSDTLRARGIQGLVLGPRADGAPPPALHWDYFSVVSTSIPLAPLTVPTVCNDHYFSSLLAMRECHQLGYRRPGIILRRNHRDFFQGRWEAGFATAQQTLPGIETTRPLYAERIDEPERFMRDELKHWLKTERPDAILMFSAEASGLEQSLLRLGYRVPQEIGLVGLSCPAMGDRLSGVYQNGRLMGATAVDVLVGMVERHEKGLPDHTLTTMVEGRWNSGATVHPQSTTVRKPASPRSQSAAR